MLQGSDAQKVIVGFILFCLHARVRVGDALRTDVEPRLDVPDPTVTFDFLEAGFMKHKTSYRARSKLRLPVVAEAYGVTGTPWARLWLDAREALGLKAYDARFLLPTVVGSITDPSFGQVCATTSEVTVLLSEVLALIMPETPLDKYGSHSLKPTLLSWCAKFGVPSAIRRSLVGHAKGKGKAVLAYSRDELSEPLRHLQKVLKAVRDDSFDPDATRSGLMRTGAGSSRTLARASDAAPVGDSVRVVRAEPYQAPEFVPPTSPVDSLFGLDEETAAGAAADHDDPPRIVQSTAGLVVDAASDDSQATPYLGANVPGSPSAGSSTSSSGSDDDPESDASIAEADHLLNPKSGVFHRRHESLPGRLRCGRVVCSGLRSAEFTVAYSLDANRCKGCHR